jgi:hypothetical protein
LLTLTSIVPLTCYLIGVLSKDPMPAVLAPFVWFLAIHIVCFFFAVFWVESRYIHPVSVATIRDLALTSLAQPPQPDPDGGGLQSPANVWARLTAILSKHTGVAASQIYPQHRFYELGL